VTPSYDLALDSRAIQEQTLRQKVAAEMGLKLEADQKAGPIDLTNPKVQKAIDSLHDELTNKGLLKRLQDKFEKPPAGHYEAAQEKLTQSIEVKESDLIKLAHTRGEAIRESLITAGIDAQRVRIEKAVTQKTSDKKANTTQTKLSLEVNKSMAKAETSETKAN
jgi:ribosomal protein L25 (general stress protein Ctc)